jgi:hypothetical protein
MANTAYRALQKANPKAYPLFHQDWWLDIACGGKEHWQGLTTDHDYKGSQALMPVPLIPKWRLIPTVRRPLLSPYLGPWSAGLAQLDKHGRFQLARQLWPELIRQLPRVPYLHQTFRPELVHALPFHEAGYRLHLRYAYRLRSGERHFNRNNRRALKRAEDLQVWQAPTTEILYQLLQTSLGRQGLGVPFSASLMEALHQAAAQRQQSQIWVAGPQHEDAQAAIWVLWDAFCIYVLSNGVSTAGRKSGAYPKLIAHLLAHPPVSDLPVDLCGTMLPAVAEINVGLGAETSMCLDLERGSIAASWLLR